MPIVTIDWYEGRTPEQKQAIAERLTDLLVDVGKAPREHVWIRFVDSRKGDWAMDGELQG